MEEETEESEDFVSAENLAAVTSPESISTTPGEGCPLNGPEYRLLQSLLYGGSIGWVQNEGHLLSVLVDGINEKLYDTFMDSVLEDTPELVEDYIDDLKEMVAP